MTGNEALKAHKKADILTKDVNELVAHIKTTLASKEPINVNLLVKKIIVLNETINQSQVSYWRKDFLRKELRLLRNHWPSWRKLIKPSC